jgi:hypothetical protein
MTYDGNGEPAYYGPVARSAAGSTNITLPHGTVLPKGGGDAMLVVNGSGFGQIHPITRYDSESLTLTLATALMAEIGADAWIQTLAFQGRNIFHENSFADNGAFQMYGTSFQTVFAGNVGRRMGGMMSWGQVQDPHARIGSDLYKYWLLS